MNPQSRVSTRLHRRLGSTVVLAAAAVLAVGAAPASAQTGSLSPDQVGGAGEPTGSGESGGSIGVIPEEIVVGPGVGGGSEGLRDMGSDAIPDTAQSVGEVAGSVAPLEALGSTGGSAAGSVASSGSLPGSVYTNPTGSIGSGTIGLGSIAVPEIALPILSLEFAAGFATATGERQEAGELYPHEIDFWHGVTVGSAEGATAVEDAAESAGVTIPEPAAGSIDSVQEAAAQDPYEQQERRRAAAEAEATAEEAGENSDQEADGEYAQGPGEAAADAESEQPTDADAADGRDDEVGGGDAAGDDDEVTAGRTEPVAADTQPAAGTGVQGASAPVAAAPVAAAPVAADAVTADPAPRLAETGAGSTALVGLALTSLLVGGLLVGDSRRRA